jgi:tRNA (guanine-N7-)-methyltransferase
MKPGSTGFLTSEEPSSIFNLQSSISRSFAPLKTPRMGKDKLRKWNENRAFPHVFEPPLAPIIKEGQTFKRGQWHETVFANDRPLTVELGCGKGEYTVGLARMYPERNFLGVDVKGHRFHKGASEALAEGMKNVAFLRTRIEFIEAFFGPSEVDQIWLTFSDPQPKDEKGRKRLSSPYFIEKYKTFLKPGGLVHLKTDNTLLYEYTLEHLTASGTEVLLHSRDVYGPFWETLDEEWRQILGIRTFYEQMFMAEGETIKYIRFRP